MRNVDFMMESDGESMLLKTCFNCAMENKTHGANDTDIMNGTFRNEVDYGYSDFDNPFNKPFNKVVFITCYSLVFIFCVIGNLMVLFAIGRSLSLTYIIVWYCTPLLLIAALYYRVARVLWKTTVISALRLKSNADHCMTATSSIKLSPQSSYDQCNDVDNTEDRVIVRSGFNNDSVRSHRPNMYRSAFMTSTKRVAKARRKVIRLLMFVVITFAFCVFPHMLKVLDHYWSFLKLSQQTMLMLSPICFIVLYLNSALNPFLYAMFSANFRRSFNESVSCCKI